jgi:hypothetical protein
MINWERGCDESDSYTLFFLGYYKLILALLGG